MNRFRFPPAWLVSWWGISCGGRSYAEVRRGRQSLVVLRGGLLVGVFHFFYLVRV